MVQSRYRGPTAEIELPGGVVTSLRELYDQELQNGRIPPGLTHAMVSRRWSRREITGWDLERVLSEPSKKSRTPAPRERKREKVVVEPGTRFGMLTVLHEEPPREYRNGGRTTTVRYVMCRCSCKNRTRKSIALGSLRKGKTVSCGCHHKKVITTRGGVTRKDHPHNGMLQSYQRMMARCYGEEKKDQAYQRDGIQVCRTWRDPKTGFDALVRWNASLPEEEQWCRGLTLDRINSKGHYVPSNCRWNTHLGQTLNRGVTIMVQFRGRERMFWTVYRIAKREKLMHPSVTYNTALKRWLRSERGGEPWALRDVFRVPARGH